MLNYEVNYHCLAHIVLSGVYMTHVDVRVPSVL